MSIDIASFTPGVSLTGGLVIGTAAAVLVFFNGRTAGISGILGGLLRAPPKNVGWRIAFIAAHRGAFAGELVGRADRASNPSRVDRDTNCRISGWHRHALCEWLHSRPWSLRHIARLHPFACCDGNVHGKRFADCAHLETSAGRLRCVWSLRYFLACYLASA